MNNANLVNQTSAESGFEYYTPPEWTAATRTMFGVIDLDPASNAIANKTVQAKQFFTIEDDGLVQPWHGRVWMNHPFHRGEAACPTDHSKCKKKTCQKRGYHIDEPIPSNANWINKLLHEYECGNIDEAVIITFCNSSETWFRPLLQWPQCFPNNRVHYQDANGDVVPNCTKGSVITYIGTDIKRFAKAFDHLGTIKVPYRSHE